MRIFSTIPARLTLILLLAAFAVAAQKPAPTATPAVTVTDNLRPTPTPAQGRTLADLQGEIRGRLLRPELRRGQVGIKIVSLNTGKVVFEENAEKYFMPASNMKNFTVAAALEKLTPDYRFVTSVYAVAMPEANGTVRGDLRIYGRGDVSISTAFFPTVTPTPFPASNQPMPQAKPTPAAPSEAPRPPATPVPPPTPVHPDIAYYQGIDKLVDKIIAAGVKRIEGSIIGDDTYFKGYPIPETWEWDDLQAYFGAEVSALSINDNAVDLEVRPAAVGNACTVKLSPYNTVYRIRNLCTTTPAGTPRTLRIEKDLGQNSLLITGNLPAGNGGFSNSVAVSRPAELFAALMKMRLEQRGVTVTGQYRVQSPLVTSAPPESVEIAKLESPPLSLIAAKTMKPSQNMYTEVLLWTIGEETRKLILTNQPPPDSAALGKTEVSNFLTGIGVAPDGIVQYDGSGLSRHNLITPAAVVQLYSYMAKQSKYAQAWRDSLTIAGVDGTLRNRFTGTAAQNNMRGKTGTIDQVSALSGYVTTAAGEQLVVSFIINGVRTTRDRTGMMDDIVVALARFNGKID